MLEKETLEPELRNIHTITVTDTVFDMILYFVLTFILQHHTKQHWS